jgi:hypothetical protein
MHDGISARELALEERTGFQEKAIAAEEAADSAWSSRTALESDISTTVMPKLF